MRGVFRTLFVVAATTGLLLAGCARQEPKNQPPQEPAKKEAAPAPAAPAATELTHVHGLSYSAEGSQIIIPAHDGLRVYANGKWGAPNLPKHDYMGYVAVMDGFYASGHPAPGSGLKNPLGIVKSADGKTLTPLAFSGETDFHLMGAGYVNQAIYVYNEQPNSKLGKGVYYTLDQAKTWQQSKLEGITHQLLAIAVHPLHANIVALGTEGGAFLSFDHGHTFQRVGGSAPASAVVFSPDGGMLLFGLQKLSVYYMAEKQVRELPSPKVTEKDAIAYIAVSPAGPDHMVLATYARDVHVSTTGGDSWKQIAVQGKGQ